MMLKLCLVIYFMPPNNLKKCWLISFSDGVPFQVVYKESLRPNPTEQCHEQAPQYETIGDVSNGGDGGGEYAEVRDVAAEEEGVGAPEPLYVELESSACEENSGCGYTDYNTHCSWLAFTELCLID
jgi:hypothetical protein